MVTEEFFDGALTAHGIVKDRGGRVMRTFNADINAYWGNGTNTVRYQGAKPCFSHAINLAI